VSRRRSDLVRTGPGPRGGCRTQQFETSSADYAYGSSVDSTSVYVVGWTDGDLGESTNAGGRDSYVRKYDHDGSEVWTRLFRASVDDFAIAIAVDASGVYAAGYTNGILPGQTSAGGIDTLVRKLDLTGNVVWTRQFGSSGNDFGTGSSADDAGAYVSGTTFGPLPGQTSSCSQHAFLVKVVP